MTEEDWMKGPLPEWAIGRTEGRYVLGAQLPTRDGRRCGNAHIIDIAGDNRSPFLCLTDAGTELRLTASEVRELFHDPKWVSYVPDVLQRFSRSDSNFHVLVHQNEKASSKT
jgi:hypothetical protein